MACSPSDAGARNRRDGASRASRISLHPGFLAAIAAEAFGDAGVNMAALIPMLADQLLLAVLNLGLIAMPGEQAQARLREAACVIR